MIEVHFAPLEEGARLPSRAHDTDAGFDLYVSESCTIAPGQFRDVPCGVAVALPEGSWGLLTGRSSTLRGLGLMVHPGVIDQGYRGPLFAGAFNLGRADQRVEAGSRIAQLIVIPQDRLVPVESRIDQLPLGERGSRGFGSSGR